jgi:formylglycine-generating enzyme required for sulfatase activity
MGESNHPLVTLDAFYIGKHEVTKAEWDRVRNWGNSGNYNLPEGSGMANNHPVHSITWYDMVEWCNARSEKEGLTPVYYTDDAQTKIYRGGVVNLTDARVRWEANGYRLPTEAEWEKAARGGLSRKRFPWGDTIDHSQANFLIYYFDYYRGESAVEYHPSALGYYKTTPVGILQANGYGLYDMAGNVAERCWDWNASPFWSYGSWTVTNWRGPSSGTSKVYRGGCSLDFADDCGVARRAGYHPNNQLGQNNETLGFRVARSLDPAEFAYVAKGTLPSSSELSGQSVSSFYIAKTETTWGQWQSVRAYAAANGYDIGSAGAGNGNDYPVTDVTWYQVVKWCNARSEMEGLTPVYMINNLIYKTGEIEPTLNAMANGYRLPTDAQWEFAARGGASTKNYEYSGSIYMDEVAWYNNNSGNATRIVGTKKANELGVYDMSGNVWEWCESWYPDGSIPSAYRTSRGGSWYLNGSNCRVAYRYYMDPSISLNDFGFRVVRSP